MAGIHFAIAPHSDAVSRQIDPTFDFAIDKERLRTGDFAGEDKSFTNVGLIAGRNCGGASG
jgi:hypothetical protein